MHVPVSVVIPELNAERFIGEAIESVQAQTLSVPEIIVVDNDCTDRTAQIASRMAAAQSMRDSLFSIVNMLRNPEKYPAGAPEVYRDRLKANFLTVERALHKQRESNQNKSGTLVG
jgi:glycosyltransferase involved in cell wall biosynthesis